MSLHRTECCKLKTYEFRRSAGASILESPSLDKIGGGFDTRASGSERGKFWDFSAVCQWENRELVIPRLDTNYTVRQSSAMILGGNGRNYVTIACL